MNETVEEVLLKLTHRALGRQVARVQRLRSACVAKGSGLMEVRRTSTVTVYSHDGRREGDQKEQEAA
ncbi:MAG TPA: hypothetical protein VIV66_11310 [Pyrinomonadaceae bacterium]